MELEATTLGKINDKVSATVSDSKLEITTRLELDKAVEIRARAEDALGRAEFVRVIPIEVIEKLGWQVVAARYSEEAQNALARLALSGAT